MSLIGFWFLRRESGAVPSRDRVTYFLGVTVVSDRERERESSVVYRDR